MKKARSFKPKSSAKQMQRKPGTQSKFSKRNENERGARRREQREEVVEQEDRSQKKEWKHQPTSRDWIQGRSAPPTERRAPLPSRFQPTTEGKPPRNGTPQHVAHHGQMIMGRNCVMEVLKHAPQRLVRVYTTKEDGDELLDGLRRANVEIVVMRKDELSTMIGSESHQSFVAQVRPRPEIGLEDYLESARDTDLVVALDSITDPQNLGAILRAAECFGVGAVMWSKNRGVDITPVVTKVSVGASEIVALLKVSNLVEELKKFKDAGYAIVTAEVDSNARSLFEFEFPEKTVLVLGSEGEGIRRLLSAQADFRVYVPMAGKIDSLNVSQAASVFLARWKLG